MGVFSGSTPEACYVKYGAIPLKAKCCHEIVTRNKNVSYKLTHNVHSRPFAFCFIPLSRQLTAMESI